MLAVGIAASTGSTAAATAKAVPSNTRLPSISGSARDGRILTASTGRWTESPSSYAYSWQRCDSQAGSCTAIAGADGRRYTIATVDVGSRIRVVVTATNDSGSGSATSRPTAIVAASGGAPEIKALPSISGATQEGATLTAYRGTWAGTQPIRFDFTWQRCDGSGNNCSTFIAHSGAKTYTLGAPDLGHRMRIEVTATNARGSRSVFSGATGAVAAPAPAPTAIAVQRVAPPDLLVIDRVSFSPNPAVSRSAPITARFHVSDTKGLSVQGALVYALGLPYGWTYNAPEQPTDGSGWATITIQPTSSMPLRRGGELVIFVRARKPGDSLLAGVSTRRLVQEGIG
jgi:hypothetical protein